MSTRNLLFRIGSEIVNEAKDNAPYRTGNLQRDIQVWSTSLDGLELELGNSKLAYYAPYVHEGTGKRARNKAKTNGKIKRGGIKPQPYLTDAVEEYVNGSGLERALSDAADDIGEEILVDIENSLKNVSFN